MDIFWKGTFGSLKTKLFCLLSCAVPEEIHTHHHGRSSEISKGRGVLRAKISKAKYEDKL